MHTSHSKKNKIKQNVTLSVFYVLIRQIVIMKLSPDDQELRNPEANIW